MFSLSLPHVSRSVGALWVAVLIRHSKTDQDTAEDEVAVPYGTHPQTCPVRSVRAWRAALAAAGVTAGPVFRRIDRHGTLGRAANGRGSEDGRLTGQTVGIVLSRLAERAGPGAVPPLTAHSLRAGLATTAYASGADTLAIARHGRWKDGSPVLLGYVRAVDRWRSNRSPASACSATEAWTRRPQTGQSGTCV